MKVLESAPRRYDFGIRILSLGRIDRGHQEMAEWGASDGVRALDIGCGTGSLAIACARRGAQVTGIDISPLMLDIARQKVEQAGLEDSITLMETSAIELDEKFEAGSFDTIMSSLTFSELSDDEQRFVLGECHRLLKDGGRLIIADEVVPPWPRRALHLLVRLPLMVVTYILTQTTTGAVAQLEAKIAEADFRVEWTHRNLLGDFETVAAVKEPTA
jgi:demethylmenaquinone methyltransferase/2-methoxy-6-polyprenyl-1,4-benzoquinol methylase